MLREISRYCPRCRKESKTKHCKSKQCTWFKCECGRGVNVDFIVFSGIHFFKSRGV